MLIRIKEEPHEISIEENGIPLVDIPICARPKTEMTDTRVIQKQSASPAKSAANSEVIDHDLSYNSNVPFDPVIYLFSPAYHMET